MEKNAIITTGSLTHSKITSKHSNVYRDIQYTLNFSDEVFFDQKINQKKLFKLITKKKEIPKTSQPSYSEIKNILLNRLKKYENLFIIAPSRELSGTYQGCINVIKDLKEEANISTIYLIEAPSIAVSETYIVEQLLIMLKKEIPIPSILEELSSVNGDTYAFPTDVEFLKLSGRVSNSQALAINFLKIRPIVQMLPYKKPEIVHKARGFKNSLKYIDKYILGETSSSIEKIYFSNISLEKEEYTALINFFTSKKLNFEEVEIAPPVVATHFGPKSFGLFIIHKH